MWLKLSHYLGVTATYQKGEMPTFFCCFFLLCIEIFSFEEGYIIRKVLPTTCKNWVWSSWCMAMRESTLSLSVSSHWKIRIILWILLVFFFPVCWWICGCEWQDAVPSHLERTSRGDGTMGRLSTGRVVLRGKFCWKGVCWSKRRQGLVLAFRIGFVLGYCLNCHILEKVPAKLWMVKWGWVYWNQTAHGAGVTWYPLEIWRKPVAQTWEKTVLEIWGCLPGTAWPFLMSAHLCSLPAGWGNMKEIHVHPLDSNKRLLVQRCYCSACCGMASKHVDFHTSPGADIPRGNGNWLGWGCRFTAAEWILTICSCLGLCAPLPVPAPIFHWSVSLLGSCRIMSRSGLQRVLQACKGNSRDVWPGGIPWGLLGHGATPAISMFAPLCGVNSLSQLSPEGVVTCVMSMAGCSLWGLAANALGRGRLCPLVQRTHAYTGKGNFSWPVRECSDLAWAMLIHAVSTEKGGWLAREIIMIRWCYIIKNAD